MEHLLAPSALDAAAPGVLSVVFGPDGDFDGAPNWRGPLVSLDYATNRVYDSGVWLDVIQGGRARIIRAELPTDVGRALGALNSGGWRPLSRLAFDTRVPSVAARLAGLLLRVAVIAKDEALLRDARVVLVACAGGPWSEAQAARFAALILLYAPQIAALGGRR